MAAVPYSSHIPKRSQLKQKKEKMMVEMVAMIKWWIWKCQNSRPNEAWLCNTWIRGDLQICQFPFVKKKKLCGFCLQKKPTWLWRDAGGFEKWLPLNPLSYCKWSYLPACVLETPLPVVVCHFFSSRQQQGTSYKGNRAIAHAGRTITHLMCACVISKIRLPVRWRTGANTWCMEQIVFVCRRERGWVHVPVYYQRLLPSNGWLNIIQHLSLSSNALIVNYLNILKEWRTDECLKLLCL